jgi:hypothetical protein
VLPYGQNTVAHSTRTVPIILSSIAALLLVGGAYVLSGPNPFFTTRVDAKSAEELLKAYAAKDTDGDALPDWQEALYGTDPANPRSYSADLTDGEAATQGLLVPTSLAAQVPEDEGSISGVTPTDTSLTAQFSQKFFSRYFSTRGSAPPSEEEVLAFVGEAVAELEASRFANDTFSVRDVELSPDTGASALVAYAARAETALRGNAVPADRPDLDYFVAAVERGDTDSIEKLADISEGYEAVGSALIAVPVPQEAAIVHIALANALIRLGAATGDLAALTNDPVRALLGLGGYQRYELEYAEALADMHAVFAKNGAMVAEGENGHAFFNAMTGVAAALGQRAP